MEKTESLANYRKQVEKILKKATYSELCNYLKLIPKNYETDDILYYWSNNYVNEYYRKVAILEKNKTEQNKKMILATEKRLYAVYNIETYNSINLSFEEFITFSKLVAGLLTDESNFILIPYNSLDESLGYIFNIPKVINIDEIEEKYYTVNRLKLDILSKMLHSKREETLKSDFDSCQFTDENIDAIFSKKIAHKVKKLIK